MTFLALLFTVVMSSARGQTALAEPPTLTDEQIKALLVQASRRAHSGECPCPDSRNSKGALCGRNSAYSRPGGNRPLCYPSNVSAAMIERYRGALAKP